MTDIPTYQILPHEDPDAQRNHLVPQDARCVACGRGPRKGTKYGPGKLQWDRRSGHCGPCFDEAYQGKLWPDDPGDTSGRLET